jgi:hypothetical protein
MLKYSRITSLIESKSALSMTVNYYSLALNDAVEAASYIRRYRSLGYISILVLFGYFIERIKLEAGSLKIKGDYKSK